MSDCKPWPDQARRSGGAARLRSVQQPRSGATRVPCNEPCEVQEAGWRRGGTLWNLSILGAYVVLDGAVPALNTQVHLSFTLPADPVPIKVQACVAWQNPAARLKSSGVICPAQPPGCGVEFLTMSAEDRDRVSRYVRAAGGAQ